MVLLQRRSEGVVAGVAVERVGLRWIGDEQHRRAAQRSLQRAERLLLPQSPHERRRLLGQLREGQRDLAEVLDEAAVEPGEAEEGAHIGHVLQLRPVAHVLHLVLRDGQALRSDAMAEELHLGAKEFALAALGVELAGAQTREDLAHVGCMFLLRAAEDEDVVEEDEHTAVQQVAECVVHQLHEGAGRVAEAHRQHSVLEAAVACAERGLLHVLLCDANLMEARAQIDLCEILGSPDAIE